MKYYSEAIGHLYDTEAEALAAEAALRKERESREAAKRKAAEERAADAKKVDEAREAYMETLKSFCEKHGAYHCTVSPTNWLSLFDLL